MRSLEELDIPGAVRVALSGVKEALRARFGARLLDVRLFGSRARGEGRTESDADVLIVLDRVDRADFDAVTDLCADVLLAHDLLVDPRLMSLERWRHHREQERPLVMDVERDGVPL